MSIPIPPQHVRPQEYGQGGYAQSQFQGRQQDFQQQRPNQILHPQMRQTPVFNQTSYTSDVTSAPEQNEEWCRKQHTLWDSWIISPKDQGKDKEKEKGKGREKDRSKSLFGGKSRRDEEKAKAKDSKTTERWVLADVVKGGLASKTVSQRVKELDEGRKTVADKEAALFPNQRKQLNLLLQRLNSQCDVEFSWTLAQMESKLKEVSSKSISRSNSKSKTKQTISITFYLKLAPLPGVNCMALHRRLSANGHGYQDAHVNVRQGQYDPRTQQMPVRQSMPLQHDQHAQQIRQQMQGQQSGQYQQAGMAGNRPVQGNVQGQSRGASASPCVILCDTSDEESDEDSDELENVGRPNNPQLPPNMRQGFPNNPQMRQGNVYPSAMRAGPTQQGNFQAGVRPDLRQQAFSGRGQQEGGMRPVGNQGQQRPTMQSAAWGGNRDSDVRGQFRSQSRGHSQPRRPIVHNSSRGRSQSRTRFARDRSMNHRRQHSTDSSLSDSETDGSSASETESDITLPSRSSGRSSEKRGRHGREYHSKFPTRRHSVVNKVIPGGSSRSSYYAVLDSPRRHDGLDSVRTSEDFTAGVVAGARMASAIPPPASPIASRTAISASSLDSGRNLHYDEFGLRSTGVIEEARRREEDRILREREYELRLEEDRVRERDARTRLLEANLRRQEIAEDTFARDMRDALPRGAALGRDLGQRPGFARSQTIGGTLPLDYNRQFEYSRAPPVDQNPFMPRRWP